MKEDLLLMRSCLVAGLFALFIIFLSSSLALASGLGTPYYTSGRFSVAGDSYDYADIGLGVFSFHNVDDGDGATEINAELRFGRKFYFVGPLIGMLANTDGGVYGYAGFYADLAYGRFVLTPVMAMGGYSDGKSRRLGGNFLFRLALNFDYQAAERVRLGLRLGHISNANLDDKNPGEDEVLFTFAYGF